MLLSLATSHSPTRSLAHTHPFLASEELSLVSSLINSSLCGSLSRSPLMRHFLGSPAWPTWKSSRSMERKSVSGLSQLSLIRVPGYRVVGAHVDRETQLLLAHSPSIHITSIAENKFLPSVDRCRRRHSLLVRRVVLVDLLSICSLVYSSVYPSRLSSVTAFTASAKT